MYIGYQMRIRRLIIIESRETPPVPEHKKIFVKHFNFKKMANINYSVGKSAQNFGQETVKIVYRPYIQLTGAITLDDIAEHMSEHNSKYDDGDITAVLKQFVRCVVEMLLEGYKVDLGKLGCLRPSIKTTCEESASEVTSDNITAVYLSWSPGEKTKDLRKLASFTNVAKRRNQKLLISAEKNGQTSMTLHQSGMSEGGSQSGGVSGE